MTRMAQTLRACRLLRSLSAAGTPSLLQTAAVTSAVGCQPSTSGGGCDHDGYRALLALGRQVPQRFFSLQTSSADARIHEVAIALRELPESLSFDRGEVPIPSDLDNPLGRAMLKIMGFESKRSKLLHGAQRLYEAVTDDVDTDVLQRSFQTGKTFWSTYVLLSLHVWMVIHRLRTCTHADVRFFRQRFYNQFQQDVEYRVYAAGVQVGVSKWLKKLEEHFYETAYEFDQTLAPDAKDTLADAILRKYYGGEEKHRADADLLSRYATRELQCLAMTDDEMVLRGHVRFSSRILAAVHQAEVTSPVEADSEASAGTAGEAAGGAGLDGPMGFGVGAPAQGKTGA